MCSDVHCGFVYSGQDMERTKVAFNRCLGKENMVYNHNRKLFCHKKSWNCAISTNIDGFWDYNSKWISQTEKFENHMISLTCGT